MMQVTIPHRVALGAVKMWKLNNENGVGILKNTPYDDSVRFS